MYGLNRKNTPPLKIRPHPFSQLLYTRIEIPLLPGPPSYHTPKSLHLSAPNKKTGVFFNKLNFGRGPLCVGLHAEHTQPRRINRKTSKVQFQSFVGLFIM